MSQRTDDATYDVTIDRANNRYYLTLSGRMDQETAAEAADAAIDAAGQLNDGFEIVNDISEFVPASEAAANEIARGKEAMGPAGVAAVVRVTGGGSVTGKMQFDRVGDAGYQAAEAETVEEAERLLDSR